MVLEPHRGLHWTKEVQRCTKVWIDSCWATSCTWDAEESVKPIKGPISESAANASQTRRGAERSRSNGRYHRRYGLGSVSSQFSAPLLSWWCCTSSQNRSYPGPENIEGGPLCPPFSILDYEPSHSTHTLYFFQTP